MDKVLNINLFYKENGVKILEVLTNDFSDFLDDYIKKILK